MKKFGILVLLVHVVVEMFASVDARFIQPHGIAVLKSAVVEHVGASLKELLDSFDTKPPAPNNCSCEAHYVMTITINVCGCTAYVNDTSSGIKGIFTFMMLYMQEEVTVVLALDKNFVVSGFAKVGLSDRFTFVACNQSEETKGKNICLVMDGERSRATKQITECVRIESPPLNVNLGCFSFINEDANKEIQLDGTLKVVDAKQKKRTLLKRSFSP